MILARKCSVAWWGNQRENGCCGIASALIRVLMVEDPLTCRNFRFSFFGYSEPIFPNDSGFFLAGFVPRTFILPVIKRESLCNNWAMPLVEDCMNSYFIAYEWCSWVVNFSTTVISSHGSPEIDSSISIFGMTVFWVTFSLKLCVLRLQNFRICFICYNF